MTVTQKPRVATNIIHLISEVRRVFLNVNYASIYSEIYHVQYFKESCLKLLNTKALGTVYFI
jgi:hypothetical protein